MRIKTALLFAITCTVSLSMNTRAEQIFVQTWEGMKIVLEIDPSETIRTVKENINSVRGIPVSEQILEYKGQTLANNSTIVECGISEGEFLYVEPNAQRFTAVSKYGENIGLAITNLVSGTTNTIERALKLLPTADWEDETNIVSGWGFTNVALPFPTNSRTAFYRINTVFPDTNSPPLSHGIPLTYSGGKVDGLRELAIVKTAQSTFWVAMAENSSSWLYLMKTDEAGRTLVPPFHLVGELKGSTVDLDEDYPFAIVPISGGGLQVLTFEDNPDREKSSDPNVLMVYRFDSAGRMTDRRIVYYPDGGSSAYFKDIQAYRTDDGKTVFVAKYKVSTRTSIVYGIINDDGGTSVFTVYDNLDPGGLESACNPVSSRVFVYFLSGYDPDHVMLSTWDFSGNKIAETNLDSIIGEPTGEYERPRLAVTERGLLLARPRYEDNLELYFFNPDTLDTVEQHTVGARIAPRDGDCRMSLCACGTNEFGIAWTEHGPYAVKYCLFSLDGTITSPVRNAATDEKSYDPRNVHLFCAGNRATIFYQYYINSIHRWRLTVSHIGEDFPPSKPDLVISAPCVAQSPPYATFNSEIQLKATVFNQGETASVPTTMCLNGFMGNICTSVPAMSPGAYTDLVFNVSTPAFLTNQPVYSLVVNDTEGWSVNNTVSNRLEYPPYTPIYPQNSSLYTWAVKNKVTHESIPWAHYSLRVPKINTVGSGVSDIVISGWTDSNGEFSTVLPTGTYTNTISRHGYPTTEYVFTVPHPASTDFLLEPPGNLVCTFTDNNGSVPLHPAPNPVTIELYGHTQGFTYEGHGDQNGLNLSDIMPGEYQYTVRAFGYYSQSGSHLSITGGQDNAYSFALTATDRGTITGYVTGAGSPLDDAQITIPGTPLSASSSGGYFGISDVPYSNYTLIVSSDGYCSTNLSVTVNSALSDVDTINLREINLSDQDLGHWVSAAWNDVEEVPGTFFTPNYKVTCTYGVFDFTGSLSMEQTSNSAHIDSINMTINGWKWYYYSVSTSFSLTDLVFAGIEDEVISGAGDLCATLVDKYDNGFFDFLEVNVGTGGAGGTTVVRVDSIQVRENDAILWNSHDHLIQKYSTDGTFTLGIDTDIENINDVAIRVYLKVTNENYDIGPLFLRDKMMFEWIWNGNRFQIQNPVINPIDYPSFDF